MHERLSQAAAKDGRSLSEEIEARLAQSFEVEQRITAFQETWDKRIEDWRRIAEQLRGDVEQQRQEIKNIREQAKLDMAQQAAELKKMESEVEKYATTATMIDILLGEDKLKSDLLRQAVLSLAKLSRDELRNMMRNPKAGDTLRFAG